MILRKSHHIQIFIMKSTRSDWGRWCRLVIDGTKFPSTGFINFSNHDTSNIPNLSNLTVNSILVSQTKCDVMFLDPDSDNIFLHFLGTYLVYIFFLLVCGNYPLTSNRGRCGYLLSFNSRFNRIDRSTNMISPPNAEQGYRTKFEILIGEVFQYII